MRLGGRVGWEGRVAVLGAVGARPQAATRPGRALMGTERAASHTRRSAREARQEGRQGQEEVEARRSRGLVSRRRGSLRGDCCGGLPACHKVLTVCIKRPLPRRKLGLPVP